MNLFLLSWLLTIELEKAPRGGPCLLEASSPLVGPLSRSENQTVKPAAPWLPFLAGSGSCVFRQLEGHWQLSVDGCEAGSHVWS